MRHIKPESFRNFVSRIQASMVRGHYRMRVFLPLFFVVSEIRFYLFSLASIQGR